MKEINAQQIVDNNLDLIINDIKKAVAINSVYDAKSVSKQKPFGANIANMLEFMTNLCESYDFTVKNIDNVCLELKISGRDNKTFGIMSHLDTVPVTNNFKTNPFELTKIGDKFYGRGSSDNKGPSIMVLWALKLYKELNLTPKYNIKAIFGTDEERGSSDLSHYFSKNADFDYGFSPDTDFPIIYLEKSFTHYKYVKSIPQNIVESDITLNKFNGGIKINVVCDFVEINLKTKNKQILQKIIKKLTSLQVEFEVNDLNINIFCYGKAAHAKKPIAGKNAIFIATGILKLFKLDQNGQEFINFLNNYFSNDVCGKKLGIFDQDEHSSSTNNLAIVNWDGKNCAIEFNYRSTLSTNLELINSKLIKLGNLYNYNLEIISQEKPHFVAKDSHNIKMLQQAYFDIMQKDVKLGVNGGRTYASMCKNTVAFGPLFKEDEAKIHSDEESISLRSIRNVTAIYLQVLINMSF